MKRPRDVLILLAWASAGVVAGCGQGQVSAGDAGADSALVAPADASGEAATLNNYLGSWTVQGTQIQDCAGQAQTVDNSGSLDIEVGTASDLLVTGTCIYPFDIENGAAEMVGVHSCVSYGFTITYQSWTILTTDGQTGVLVAAGRETETTSGEVAYSCLITEEGTLSR
jgi:hypothetical protein